MQQILLTAHLLIALILIGLVLIQRSEGGALGMGGNNNLFSPRGVGNALTRATAILATAFFITSISLTLVSKGRVPSSFVDQAAQPAATEPAPATGSEGESSTTTPDGSALLPKLDQKPAVPTN